jgi:hypothetical protein
MSKLNKRFTELRTILNQYSEDDIEAAQDRDFDFWLYDMNNKIQNLYDEILVNNDPTPNRKAALDVAFMEINIAIEKAEKLIREIK